MKLRTSLGLAALAATFASGCAPYGRSGGCRCCCSADPYACSAYSFDGYHPARDFDERAIREAEMAPVYTPTIPHLPPRETPPEPARVAFDTGAAYTALHAIDLAPCVERGARSGYGHVKVTFAAEGRAAKVLIDAPSGMSSDAAGCVGERLATATVPAFDGAPLTVGTTFRVP